MDLIQLILLGNKIQGYNHSMTFAIQCEIFNVCVVLPKM